MEKGAKDAVIMVHLLMNIRVICRIEQGVWRDIPRDVALTPRINPRIYVAIN